MKFVTMFGGRAEAANGLDAVDRRMPCAVAYSLDRNDKTGLADPALCVQRIKARIAAKGGLPTLVWLYESGKRDLFVRDPESKVGTPEGLLDPERVVRENRIPTAYEIEGTEALARELRAAGIKKVDGFITNAEPNTLPLREELHRVLRGPRMGKTHLPLHLACFDEYALAPQRIGDWMNQRPYVFDGAWELSLLADWHRRTLAPLAEFGPVANSHASIGGGRQRWIGPDQNGWPAGDHPSTSPKGEGIHAPQCMWGLGPDFARIWNVPADRDWRWYAMLAMLDSIGNAAACGQTVWPILRRQSGTDLFDWHAPHERPTHRMQVEFFAHVRARLWRSNKAPLCIVFNPDKDEKGRDVVDPLDELIDARREAMRLLPPTTRWTPAPIDFETGVVRSGARVIEYDRFIEL